MVLVNLLLLLMTSASASEGPWTTSKGVHNVYLGMFGERFHCFESGGKNSDDCRVGLPAPSPVAQVGTKFFYRSGLGEKTDIALGVPLVRAFPLEPSDSDKLETTTGVGLLEGRVRYRLGHFRDVDIAAGAGVRTGVFHHSTRGRITNLGEGSTDLVAILYAGSTGLLKRRFHTSSMDMAYYLRLPLETGTPVGRIPGDEIRFSAVSTVSVTSKIGLGLSADGNWRLWGEPLDFTKLDVYKDNYWASLAAAQLKAGARIVVYPGGHRPYLQFSAMRTVWARNSPLDTTFLEVATGMDFEGRK